MALALFSRRLARDVAKSGSIYSLTHLLHTTSAAAQEAPKAVPLAKLKDSFNDGTSVTYLEEIQKRYQEDPSSVDRSWGSFFRSLGTHRAACLHRLCSCC